MRPLLRAKLYHVFMLCDLKRSPPLILPIILDNAVAVPVLASSALCFNWRRRRPNRLRSSRSGRLHWRAEARSLATAMLLRGRSALKPAARPSMEATPDSRASRWPARDLIEWFQSLARLGLARADPRWVERVGQLIGKAPVAAAAASRPSESGNFVREMFAVHNKVDGKGPPASSRARVCHTRRPPAATAPPTRFSDPAASHAQ